MELQKVNIETVISNPDNPRVIRDDKFKKLVKSIDTFPQMLKLRPIVVDEDNVILGGNMRFEAIKHLGHKQVYIVKAEGLTEEQKREFVIKDNSSFGEWDWDVLANNWETSSLKEWGLDIPKWEDKTEFDSEIEDTGDYDFPEDDIEKSHVKMVQLFLSTKTEPNFKKWELVLREKLGTDNVTDTVYESMKKMYEQHKDD